MSPRSNDALNDHLLAFNEFGSGKPGVLIVDDEPQLITAMSDVLDDDYRVIGETSAPAALKILEKDPDIQLIISDQRMPQMTGDEFLARARELSSATRILVTAYADIDAVIKAVNGGKIFNYVQKPWNAETLLTIAEAAIQHFALGAALRQERALLNCIMDCSVDAISVKNLDHRYIRLNKAEADILGVDSAQQVDGKSPAEFLKRERASSWEAEEKQLFETLETIRDRIEHITEADGGERWFSTSKAPILAASGKPLGVLSVTRDVSEAKFLEQLKDDFISTARHELRTPLTVIMSSIKLLHTGALGDLSPKAKDLLRRGIDNCDRLISLVNNMLDIQDFRAGKVQLQREAVRVVEIIEESIALNEALSDISQIQVCVDGATPDLMISGDKQRLVQLLHNLLSNACKFSPQNTTVRIGVRQEKNRVQISVIDQGPGVSEAYADKLFITSFSQADNSGTRAHDGAGLGLYVCKAIVDAHNGTIGFEPNAGAGSEFFVTLPTD